MMALPGTITSPKRSTTLSRGGAEDFEIFCLQCDRDDIRLPAFGFCVDCGGHLCQTCFNTHRRPKPLQHHQILDIDQMPKSKFSYRKNITTDLIKPCLKHSKEMVEFYCHDHIILICSVCVALEHTPEFCHVDFIPDISGQTLDGSEFENTLRNIDKLKDKCCKITKGLKQALATSASSLKHAIADIETYRKDINERLDELEQVVKDTAAKMKDSNNKMVKTTEGTCDDINCSLQASSDTLEHLNTNKKADELFIELKIVQQQISYHENRLSQLPVVNDVDEFFFEPNQDIKTLLVNKQSLGTLYIKKIKKKIQPVNPDKVSMKISAPIYINIRKSSDEKEMLHYWSSRVFPKPNICCRF